MVKEFREQIYLTLGEASDQDFTILTISAGEGNGWHFSPEVLQSSLPLWDGVECFIDHALTSHPASTTSRSVRDIAGIITNPTWDETTSAIKARLKPLGPSAALLQSLASQLKSIPPDAARIGFSADLVFTGRNRQVEHILKVNSVDLVYNPARGGKFIFSINPQPPSIVIAQHPSPEGVWAARNEAVSALSGLRSPVLRSTPGQSPCEPGHLVSSIPQKQHFSLYNSEEPNQKGAQNMQETQPTQPSTARGRSGIQPPSECRTHESSAPPFTEQDLTAQFGLMNSLRQQMNKWTLDLGLDRSHLPRPMQDVLRKQFATREFTVSELDEAIEDQRKILSQLTGSETVRSVGRVEGMLNEQDRLSLAVEDLFGIERENNPSVKVPRLTGIRELYLMLTGDTDLHGGYYPERMQLATTADFTGLVKNALNKIVVRTWSQLGKAGYDWWKDVTTQEHFSSLHDVTGTLIGTVGDLPAIAEGAEYTELPIGDSPETASFTKYGGYIPLTLELIDRDDAKRLTAYARQLGSAGLRKISKLVAEIFTANSGIGPSMADGGALFNATAVTTAGGHANLTTTALSAGQWDTVSMAVYKQPMLIKNEAGYYGTGPALAINPKFMVIPRNLGKTAWEICAGNFVREQDYVYDNVMKGTAVPVIVPEWTDANNWAAVCDPVIAPAIYVGERFGIMPEIFVAGENTSPAVFMNDEHRLKVRHFLAVWVNDYRPLHKANVA